MELLLESLPDGVTRVSLNGRLDIQGAEKIDLPFSTLSSHRKVIVDLSKVTFLASMGIRTIVLTARSVKSKGGAMVLLDPNADVENVLVVSGIDTLIPIVHGNGRRHRGIGLSFTMRQAETLQIRPELAELQRVQAWLETIGGQFELGAVTMYALALCCEEAVSNAIRHGLPPGGGSGHTIELALWRQADLLHLRMVDPGAAFDPTAIPDASAPATLEEARVGGLGVHLMRKFSQALRYERRDGKNYLTFDFSLSPAPAPAGRD